VSEIEQSATELLTILHFSAFSPSSFKEGHLPPDGSQACMGRTFTKSWEDIGLKHWGKLFYI